MYPCSNAFHQAVANNAKQIAMFLFADGVITNEDISIERGIEFNDFFCTRDDLGIGEALSNEIEFQIMNERQTLNSFPFGQFKALLGAQIAEGLPGEAMTLTYDGHVFRGSSYSGRRLTKDGTPTRGQPSFNVAGLAALDGKVYCFGQNGEIYAVDAGNGLAATYPNNAFMHDKVTRLCGKTYSYKDRILDITDEEGKLDRYEFVPLGTFVADRPNVVDDVEIDMRCYDLMKQFDEDMNVNVAYPITLKNLLAEVCRSKGVSVETTSFINQGVTVASRPESFDSCTKRDVIAWIAEAAGCNAKMTRDGNLALVWIGSTVHLAFAEKDYTECRPYFYQTPKVNKLVVRQSAGGADTSVGSGNNGYLIQDNPFL